MLSVHLFIAQTIKSVKGRSAYQIAVNEKGDCGQ